MNRKVLAPLVLAGDAQHLNATGSIDLKQTALGLTPFSLFLGALQVQDSMQISYKVVLRMS